MDKMESIKKTTLNYIEGWYEENIEKMDLALDSRLVKRKVVSKDEIWQVTKTDMLDLTANGNGKINNPENGKKDVKILDISGNMASVKIISEKYVDYLHLCKCDGEWKIINELWDFI